MTSANSNNDKRLYTLSAQDAQALDAIMAGRGPKELRLADDQPAAHTSAAAAQNDASSQRVAAVLQLLDQCPVEDPPADLVDRALERVAQERQRQRFARQLDAVSSPPVAFRWTELITVAAVLLLGVSVIWPLITYSSERARQANCAANLAGIGREVSTFAVNHNGNMPSVAAADTPGLGNAPAGTGWTNRTGSSGTVAAAASAPGAATNLDNLYVLLRTTNATARLFACPDNRAVPANLTADMLLKSPTVVGVSYSYQNQARPQQLNEFASLAIVADRNPLLAEPTNSTQNVHYSSVLPADSPSPLHNRRGQNVLFANGAVRWVPSPVLQPGLAHPSDNIWINDAGNDQPLADGDAQLIH